MRLQVEQTLADAHPRTGGRGLGAAGAPQQRLDAGEQGARLVGLGDVVVGAGLEPDDLVDRIAACRHHDDADPAAALAQETRQDKTVLAAGQPHIEQHQRRRILLDERAQHCARRHPRSAVSVVPQEIDQGLALELLVLDNDNVRTAVFMLGHCENSSAVGKAGKPVLQRQ